MPVVAAVAIFAGAVEVTAVVAGLVYVSAATYVAGKITGNQNLMKLSAITGLAAGAVGIYDGLTGAASLAESGGGATAATDTGMSNLASDAADIGGAVTTPVPAPPSDLAQAGASLGSDAAPIANAATAGGMPPPIDSSLAGAGPTTGVTDVATNNLAGPANGGSTGLINQAPTTGATIGNTTGATTANDLSLSPAADAQAQAFTPGATPAEGLNLPPADAGNWSDQARQFWSGLSPSEKLIAGQFVSKGLGSIEDFVGPKADATKAQAGLLNAQAAAQRNQTGIINQSASKIPTASSYTFTPRKT